MQSLDKQKHIVQNIQLKSQGKLFLTLIMLLEWFALPVQFYLLLTNSQLTFLAAVVRFFSFFTILSNSIVAAYSTVRVFERPSSSPNFWNRNTTATAITVYILVVGIVYNIVLRPLLHPVGLHRVVDEIFHSVVPVLFLLYWIVFESKQNIPWSQILIWMIFPLIYVFYTLLHGWISGFYPYPFVNVAKLGLAKAMINGCFVLLAFVILSVALIGLGRIKFRK